MNKNNPVVASLPGPPFSYPYSSIALSSDGSCRINNGSYAVVAGKDTLRVLSLTHNGVNEIRSIRVSKVRKKKPHYSLVLHFSQRIFDNLCIFILLDYFDSRVNKFLYMHCFCKMRHQMQIICFNPELFSILQFLTHYHVC